MRQRFDQLGKRIGDEALGPSGLTVVHDEIVLDAQHADLRHEPDPARDATRARLGLLGRLASVLCLLEIYGHAPREDEVLACLVKLIAFRRQWARALRQARARARREARARDAPRRVEAAPSVAPFLWIVAAGRPTGVLTKLGATPAPGWPVGVYLSPELLRVGIVVASELPRTRETLLVRLMAAGPLLSQAIAELTALPADAPERALAEPVLLELQHALGKKPNPTPKEQEFIVTMYKSFEDLKNEGRKQGLREGRKEGRKEGRVEMAARAVLTALRVRGLDVPDAIRERILAQKDLALLERWFERAIVAASVAEVIDAPS